MSRIKEYGVSVACSDDVMHRERICYVRVLRLEENLLVECNGCDDYHGGEPCASCIKAVKDKIQQKEA